MERWGSPGRSIQAFTGRDQTARSAEAAGRVGSRADHGRFRRRSQRNCDLLASGRTVRLQPRVDAAADLPADVRDSDDQRSNRTRDRTRPGRKHAPPLSRPPLYVLVGLLVVANTINIGADLGAMAAALRLLVSGPILLYVAAFAAVTVLLEVFMRYARYASVLRWLTLSLFAYVGTVFAVGVPWMTVASNLVLPHLEFSGSYLTVVVAVFGTTISPYLFFWQAGEEVEDEKENPAAQPLVKAPQQAPRELARIQLDTIVGMGFSNIIALFIMLTTAATLNAHGVKDIQTSSQAAEALRPIAGDFAFAIFALGIIGTGLLALPVLAGSAAYAVGEALQWRVGLAQHPSRAKRFYGVIAAATLVGAGLNFTPLDPIKALFWSAVINGVAAVPIMVMIMLLGSRQKVMRQFTLSPWLKSLGWLATAIMAAAAIGMFATWGD